MLALGLLAGCGSSFGGGAVVGDGGVVVPALGAATGPVISAEAAKNNPIFHDAILQ